MDAPEVTVAPDVPADAGPDADAALDARDAADAGDVADGEVFVTVDVPLTGPVLPRPGRSSAVVTSPDDRVAVAVNRATNSVSVFTVTPPARAQQLAPGIEPLAESRIVGAVGNASLDPPVGPCPDHHPPGSHDCAPGPRRRGRAVEPS